MEILELCGKSDCSKMEKGVNRRTVCFIFHPYTSLRVKCDAMTMEGRAGSTNRSVPGKVGCRSVYTRLPGQNLQTLRPVYK